MGAALLPLALVGSAGTSVLQFGQRRAAGRIQEAEARTAAAQTDLATVQRERERKRNLNAALARSTALSAGRGVSAFEGSAVTGREDLIRETEISTARDRLNAGQAAQAQRSRGRIQRQQINASSGLSLLGDAARLAPLIPTRR